MITIAQQITQAAECARRLASENTAPRRSTSCPSNKQRSVGGTTGLPPLHIKILDLLPVEKEDAILSRELTTLLEDWPHYSAIRSGLSLLVKTGKIKRTGIRRAYRYYRSRP